MGAQDAHRRTQKIACCMCFDISEALSQGRRWHVEPYCDRRRDMDAPYHTWIKTTVRALEVYWLAEKGKTSSRRFQQGRSCAPCSGTDKVLFLEFLPLGTTVNFVVYCEMLKKLRCAIQNKKHGMLSATILLLHDNTRPHFAAQTQDLITSFKWERMDHPNTALIWRQVIITSSYN